MMLLLLPNNARDNHVLYMYSSAVVINGHVLEHQTSSCTVPVRVMLKLLVNKNLKHPKNNTSIKQPEWTNGHHPLAKATRFCKQDMTDMIMLEKGDCGCQFVVSLRPN